MGDMTTNDAPHTSVSAGAALLGRELTPRERAQFERGQKRARQALWALMLAVPVAVVGIAYAAQAPRVVTREWTYRTGVVRVRAEYTGGVRNGHYQAFHQNGAVSTEGQFDFGEPVGVWHSYDWNAVEVAARALGAADGESEESESGTNAAGADDDNEPSAAAEAREGSGRDDAVQNGEGAAGAGDAPNQNAEQNEDSGAAGLEDRAPDDDDDPLGPGGLSVAEPPATQQRALVKLFCGGTGGLCDTGAWARTLAQVASLARG